MPNGHLGGKGRRVVEGEEADAIEECLALSRPFLLLTLAPLSDLPTSAQPANKNQSIDQIDRSVDPSPISLISARALQMAESDDATRSLRDVSEKTVLLVLRPLPI